MFKWIDALSQQTCIGKPDPALHPPEKKAPSTPPKRKNSKPLL
jgi:hypothetical protein